MKRAFAGMSFESILAARIRLAATGLITHRGDRMEPLQPEDAPLADLYNRLASIHGLGSK
jgi:hypothetical protein